MGNAKIERQYMGKMTPFRLAAPFQPMGDQPEAVKLLTDGLRDGHWAQVLLGATGTGTVSYTHLTLPTKLEV